MAKYDWIKHKPDTSGIELFKNLHRYPLLIQVQIDYAATKDGQIYLFKKYNKKKHQHLMTQTSYIGDERRSVGVLHYTGMLEPNDAIILRSSENINFKSTILTSNNRYQTKNNMYSMDGTVQKGPNGRYKSYR